MILVSTQKDKEDTFSGLQTNLAEIRRAGGERLETLQALSVGLHEYTGKTLQLERIQEFFAIVSIVSDPPKFRN